MAPASTPQPVKVRQRPIGFADIPGWDGDDHAAAFDAFLRSAARLVDLSASGRFASPPDLLAVCRAALQHASGLSPIEAKAFFEDWFTPHRSVHDGPEGFLTGYYEPLLPGALGLSGSFPAPLYRRPPDLVNLVDETRRGSSGDGLTHARLVDGRLEPYATRAEIEDGALAGLGLELVWLTDAVDAFFVQVQGSAVIALADGRTIRVTYDGKNGHPYTSIGRALIEAGIMSAADMSLQRLKAWLREEPERGRRWMRRNASFAFFRQLEGAEAASAHGVHAIPLTTGRSLAVDAAYHAIGTPVWVTAPTLRHADGEAHGFSRLMIAQDAGSAIRGPERGDIYFGSGDAAGELAGITKHPGEFVVLLPKGADGCGSGAAP